LKITLSGCERAEFQIERRISVGRFGKSVNSSGVGGVGVGVRGEITVRAAFSSGSIVFVLNSKPGGKTPNRVHRNRSMDLNNDTSRMQDA